MTMMLALFFILSAFLVVNGFRSMPFSRRAFKFQLAAEIEVGSVSEIPNGERKIVDTEAGSVIVANVDEKFYAMNAKCPHLGLPMKKGKIEKDTNGKPIITCNFHNSKFSMEDGSCTAWCTGVLGLPNTGFLGNVMKMGSDGKPATAYPVKVEGKTILVTI